MKNKLHVLLALVLVLSMCFTLMVGTFAAPEDENDAAPEITDQASEDTGFFSRKTEEDIEEDAGGPTETGDKEPMEESDPPNVQETVVEGENKEGELGVSLKPEETGADNNTESAAEANTNPPVAENLEITTYRDVSVSGQLSAIDPDGDTITFELTTQPKKGTVELLADGSFVYAPSENKKGKDYFGFKAVDVYGNSSQEGTVIVRIEKQKSSVCYSDMVGSGDEYAAVNLAERGIFVGSCVGNDYIFEPNRTVSRGEFLAMCMSVVDSELLSGVTRTGFSDDDSIPMWVKPYVSTAVISGVVKGINSDITGPVFDSEASISYSEAAVLLNRVLGVTDVVFTSNMYQGKIPDWGYQATANLSANNIMPSAISSMTNPMTRSEVAKMLLGANELMDERK